MDIKGFLHILTSSHPHGNGMREPLREEIKEGAMDSEEKRRFYESVEEGNAMIEAEKAAGNVFWSQ